MRITAIEIENFKGIGERVRVELSPITLLFGANSAGKSTVLHALLYLRDVLERRNLDAITTPVSGAALDLGGFRRFVHGQNLVNPIRIRVNMDLCGEELPELLGAGPYHALLSDSLISYLKEEQERTRTLILNRIKSASIEIEVSWNQYIGRPVANAYTVGLNGADLIRIERAADELHIAKFDLLNPALLRKYDNDDLKYSWDVDDSADSSYTHEGYERLLENQIPRFEGSVTPLAGLRAWLPEKHDPIPDFANHESITLPPPLFRKHPFLSDEAQSESAYYLAWKQTALLVQLLIGPGRLVRDWLKNLRYIGPLRARPPREGIPEAEKGDWAEGLAAWKTLGSASEEESNAVSDWLSRNDRLNTGYRLTGKRVEATDNQLGSNGRDSILRTLLNNSLAGDQITMEDVVSGLNLNTHEVGVGLSQVIPVVVASLLSPNALVSIEQPELHIHPAMQVALGDLFIDGALKRGTQFIIETHSEHLILRLLRRIREACEQVSPAPGLKPDDVAVIWVERKAEGVEMTRLPIDETGEFTKPWPKGFFVERAGELF